MFDELIRETLYETLEIITLATAMMIIVEWVQISFKEKIRGALTAKTGNQIIGSSIL